MQSRQNLRCSLIQAVSQEDPSDRKPDPWHLWLAGHAQLKFVMTECSKTQICLMRPNWSIRDIHLKMTKHFLNHNRTGIFKVARFCFHFKNLWDRRRLRKSSPGWKGLNKWKSSMYIVKNEKVDWRLWSDEDSYFNGIDGCCKLFQYLALPLVVWVCT